MEKKYLLSFAALSVLGMTNLSAATKTQNCEPTGPAPCNADDCCTTYCLGPDNYGVNAPTCPKTCNGDWNVTVAGFYWNAHQDGMEYAVDNHVTNPANQNTPPTLEDIQQLNNVIDATYETPNFQWDFGFKAGIGYCSTCDGWDFNAQWTWYRGKANDHVEAELDDNHTLIALWSGFSPAQGSVLYATDIETHWKLELNLVDLELGRSFWTSKYLSIRPFIGLRVAYINQDWNIEHKGGSWAARATPDQDAFNNYVNIDNDYKGVGLRAGLDSDWNFGCGWSIYGNLAAAIVYGRFSIDHDEYNRRAITPHDKTTVVSIDESFRAARAMLDLGLGLQWSGMFCECQYGLTIALGWEQHMFFDQNQMWRINRIGDEVFQAGLPNNTGENVFIQRRGDLDTQGVTLRVDFAF